MTDTTRPETLKEIQQWLIRASEAMELGESRVGEELWGPFFSQYDDLLRRFARDVDCPARDIDDVVCNVWADVLKYLPHFAYDKSKGGFRRWLYRIVQHKAVDEVRRRARRHEVGDDAKTTNFWCQVVDPREADVADPWTRLYRQELVRTLWSAFEREASDRERSVVQQCVCESRDHDDVARELGLSVENVRQLKRRGLLRLRVLAAEIFGLETPPFE